MTMDLTVVMPAFNEASILTTSVDDVAAGLRERGIEFEIIVIENGSKDGTLELARGLCAHNPELVVETLQTADYGAALRHGLLLARGESVVNFDCDYYDLDFLDRAVQLVAADGGPAIVVGSKRMDGADDQRAWARRLVTMVFSTILRVGYGLKVSDTHGMKAMRRTVVTHYARQCRLGRDLFDTELILRVERAGLPTSEIAVSVEERRPARTSIAKRVPRTITGLGKLWFALRNSAT